MNHITIFEQTFSNECGICVAKSLIKYFYNKNIKKEELYSHVEITNDGISLFEFENLLSKYGIICDSYETSFNELKEHRDNKIFVALILNDSGLHYVICQFKKNKIMVYDSAIGKYELSFMEFEKIFQNVVIFCNKTKKNIDFDFNVKKIINHIDWKIFITTNVFYLISLILNIFGGLYLNKLIDNVIANNSFANLITLNIIFLWTFVSNNLIVFLINLLCYKNKIEYFKLIYFKIIKLIGCFNANIINSYNINDILNINDHVDIVANFYTNSLNKIIIDLITIFATVSILSIINYQFLILLIFFTCFIIIFNYINFKINNKSIKKNYEFNNIHTKEMLRFVNNLQNEFNYDNTKKHINNLLSNNLQTINFNNSTDFKQMLLKFFGDANNVIFYVLIITFNIILIINNQYNIGILFFCISLFQLCTSSLSNCLMTYLNFPKIKYSYELLSRINNFDHKKNEIGVYINSVSKIEINDKLINNDTLIKGKNGSGKTTLLKALTNINNYYHNIKINDILYQHLSNKWIMNNILYFSNNYVIDEQKLIEMINSPHQELLFKVINKANIKSIKNIDDLSTGQKQILSYLSLLLYKNKILLVDELLSNVQKDIKFYLNSEIKPLIIKNNFLLCVDHDRNIINKFENVLEI